ncbi:MAG: nucleoside-diphosphate kinase [Candidatus Alcyoniella australis]|nr:nucleoside-diphosphate kinase [Candidatus Alcyoniella australis]
MATELTFAIVKPNAVAAGHVGTVLSRIEAEGLGLRAMKLMQLSVEQAGGFYAVHRGKPFFDELCQFMASGPIVALILEGENAIVRWREIMGATNPANAAPGTLRAQIGESLSENSVHGSDAPDTAAFETGYFFNAMERI